MGRVVGPLICLAWLWMTVAVAAEPADILREWTSIRAPQPPMLVPVEVDPANTALLVISFDRNVCNTAMRARCPAAIPKVKHLLDAARAHHMLIVHGYPAAETPDTTVPELVPFPDEPIVHAAADMFLNSGLDALLKDKGITNVIVSGTSGNGAVLFSVVGGATKGFNLIVPADTMPADSAYLEQFSIFELADQDILNAHVKLTRSDLVGFH